MYCYYHDQQFIGVFASKKMALLMLETMLYKTLGKGPYNPNIFDGTDTIITPDRDELDLVRELGVIPGLIQP